MGRESRRNGSAEKSAAMGHRKPVTKVVRIYSDAELKEALKGNYLAMNEPADQI